MAPPLYASSPLERPGNDASASEVGSASFDQSDVIARVRENDETAARQLYRHLVPAVERALRRVSKGADTEIDDLIQVTFERLLGSLLSGSYREACSIKTWAVSIATNVALESLRSRYRERKFLAWAPFVKSDVVGAGQAQARLEVEDLQKILAAMKPKLVHTLLLHDVFGHALREIAQMEQASLPAVQSRLLRARAELLKRVAKERGES